MERKHSAPVSPAFMVSAPGKVIVFGEHAAVYGEPAIAAAISLRSYLLVTTLSNSNRTIRLNFQDIGLDHTWKINALPWKVAQLSSKSNNYSAPDTLDPELFDAVKPHAEAVSKEFPEKQRKIHITSAAAFLYLFLSLGSPESYGCVYTLRSTIPIGAGLGSSASVCVCMSSALLLQTRSLSQPYPDQTAEEAEERVKRINDWAFVGEMCIHGNPSGVDNVVSVRGKAVVFQRNDSGPPSVTPLTTFPKLPLLLINTQQPRSTAALVGQVKSLKQNIPLITESLLRGIGQLTTTAIELIRSANFGSVNNEEFNDVEHLGTLMRMNHGLLVSLGVSHPKLERVRALVDHSGIGWTKLTGAGGGGCAITLCRNDVDETLQELEQQFKPEGFQIYKTVLSADGVGVLWPAVLRDETGAEAAEPIDQAKFENAVDMEGIEKLVGVGMELHRAGWKFWT
ncbi:Mevalonate kinase [Pyrenophora seminiperda CCB06]|uniref:Mevalonate kinase n=1 Tax=Pyrenophora seminiperda CCB06 TaxID=1302712 RepID=A0A3M7MC46_9PLEO|nr:Mevalonate kinase [Pyrenophora seminiperda CCB06]